MTPPLIYYIRHGETDFNVEGRLQGARDILLNANGRAEALRCGGILRDLAHVDGRAIDARGRRWSCCAECLASIRGPIVSTRA
jgi:broad specificity phosphatase PhoE